MHRRPVDVLDPAGAVRFVEPYELEQAHLRDGVLVPARRHDERGDDGERQRDLDSERRALAAFGAQVDRPADLLDVGPHDVHADTPP
jgi:hypothetical protein